MISSDPRLCRGALVSAWSRSTRRMSRYALRVTVAGVGEEERHGGAGVLGGPGERRRVGERSLSCCRAACRGGGGALDDEAVVDRVPSPLPSLADARTALGLGPPFPFDARTFSA